MQTLIVRRWTLVALRGLIAVLFGFVTATRSVASLAALVVAFALLALADGALDLVLARSRFLSGAGWRAAAVEGGIGVLVGVATLSQPWMGPGAFLWIVAFWAFGKGAAVLIAALRVRVELRQTAILVAHAAVSVLFGLWLAVDPGPGNLAAALWVGAFAVTSGPLLVAHALLARANDREWQPVALVRVPTFATVVATARTWPRGWRRRRASAGSSSLG
jgi:uncharacterized membrane protein HdeD (DUF308 family)